MNGASDYLNDGLGDEELKAELRNWYGSVIQSMYSLFLCTSGGRDWWDLALPLVMVNPFYKYVFVFYVLFVVIGVLNVLTVVFLENATEFSDKDLVAQAQLMRADQ